MRSAARAFLAAGVVLGLLVPGAAAQTPLSDAEIERFLHEARVLRTRTIDTGVTAAERATLTDGTLTHDAQIQTIDERKLRFESPQGTEFNFRDSWRYNVAAYRLDRLIGLNMVPVSVSRRWRTAPAAFTWWIDDVMMDEGKRLKEKIDSPDVAAWNRQMQLVRVFDQLIYNVDRNIGNVLITKDWRVWAIDHTRAFRLLKELKAPGNVTNCDRRLLDGLKALDREALKRRLGDVLTSDEISALLARRDLIVTRLELLGPNALFDRPQTLIPEP